MHIHRQKKKLDDKAKGKVVKRGRPKKFGAEIRETVKVVMEGADTKGKSLTRREVENELRKAKKAKLDEEGKNSMIEFKCSDRTYRRELREYNRR